MGNQKNQEIFTSSHLAKWTTSTLVLPRPLLKPSMLSMVSVSQLFMLTWRSTRQKSLALQNLPLMRNVVTCNPCLCSTAHICPCAPSLNAQLWHRPPVVLDCAATTSVLNPLWE